MSNEISMFKLQEMFPTEETAENWFAEYLWSGGVFCRGCGSEDICLRKDGSPKKYRCNACHKKFTVRTGTLLHSSKLPLRKWVCGMCQVF